MSDKPEEPKAPEPLTDETVYPTGPSTDPRVTGPAQTEEEAKAAEEAAKKPAVEDKKSEPTYDTKGKHS